MDPDALFFFLFPPEPAFGGSLTGKAGRLHWKSWWPFSSFPVTVSTVAGWRTVPWGPEPYNLLWSFLEEAVLPLFGEFSAFCVGRIPQSHSQTISWASPFLGGSVLDLFWRCLFFCMTVFRLLWSSGRLAAPEPVVPRLPSFF